MPESLVQAAPDSTGKKLHTWQTTIGANNVEDEFTVPGEYPYATYSMVGSAVSIATASDHIMCINAGASLKVRIRRIRIEQRASAAAVAIAPFQVIRTTTTLPTGGTGITAGQYDTTDAVAGAAGRSLPAVKGTETTVLITTGVNMRQAFSATQTQPDDAWEWVQLPGMKPIVIPTGTTNGLVIKNVSAIAGATVDILVEFVETAF